MKVIDVLGHDEKVAIMRGFQFGQSEVCGIGLCIPAVRPPQIVELVDETRITRKSLGRCHFLKIVLRPKPALVPECSETAFGRDTRAGQNNNVQGFLLSMIRTRFIVEPPRMCYLSFVMPC